MVRRGVEDVGEAETGMSGEGGNRWVFLSWHWLRLIDVFSGGLDSLSVSAVPFSWDGGGRKQTESLLLGNKVDGIQSHVSRSENLE